MNIEDSTNSKKPSNKMDEKDSIGKVTGFFLFRGIINSYNEDKQKDEDTRKGIKKYGTISIILALIAALISIACLITNLSRLDLIGMSYFLMIILYILCGIIVSLIMAIYSFVFAVMQVRLNRKSIGIFGIIFSICDILLCIALIVLLVV